MAFAYIEKANWSGRRLIALFGALAINVGFLLAISNGLSFKDVFKMPEPLELVIVDTVTKTVPVTVPTPEIQPTVPEIDVPPPIVNIPLEPAPNVIEAAPVETSTAPAPLMQDEQLQADRSLTPPIYPPTSRKLNEQGTVMLMIYVLPDGRVGEARVEQSSGHARLDEAAVTAARKGWRFKPATQSGAPVPSWGRYAVRFKLT